MSKKSQRELMAEEILAFIREHQAEIVKRVKARLNRKNTDDRPTKTK